MQIYIKYEPIANFPNIVANVRRYVLLPQHRGGMPCPALNAERSGSFCRYTAE